MNRIFFCHTNCVKFFAFQIKTKDEQKYKRVHEDVLRGMDKYENDNQPQVGEIFI